MLITRLRDHEDRNVSLKVYTEDSERYVTLALHSTGSTEVALFKLAPEDIDDLCRRLQAVSVLLGDGDREAS